MALLERARPSLALNDEETSSIAPPAFVPSAVPTAFAHPGQQQHRQEEDLIDLGQERLFSGVRTSRRADEGVQAPLDTVQGQQSTEGQQGAVQGSSQDQQELLGSLGAARHAFLFALNGLVQQYFAPTRTGSPLLPSSSSALNPFADPSSLLAPFRRHSLATTPTGSSGGGETNATQPADLLLSTLLDTLHAYGARPSLSGQPMRSIERSSPLLGSPPSAATSASPVEDLHIRVDAAAADLPPTEADLARSLASLLVCIERLEAIPRREEGAGRPATQPHREPVPAVAVEPSNVYETLEREASALQARRDLRASEAATVVGAAREVEQAERELLWGRVDDLAERVRVLARRRAEGPEEGTEEAGEAEEQQADEQDREEKREGSVRSRSSSLYEADLPRYEHQQQQHGAAGHLPPAYFIDYAPDEKESLASLDETDESQPPAFTSPSPSSAYAFPRAAGLTVPASSTAGAATIARARKVSTVPTEKMQRDLDNVTSAIERLYVVSPQLANQRVEPDRRLQRERQLAKLGNAIERLSQGRLEDQRAVPSPVVGGEEEETGAQRRRREQHALDRLLDQIDRAASRTLADQRVELNGKRKEVLNSETANSAFEPLADKYEARRREYILAHTGKGRLAGQDAILQPSSSSSAANLDPLFPAPNPELSEPVTITEFFAADDADLGARGRRASLPALTRSQSDFLPSTSSSSSSAATATGAGSTALSLNASKKKFPALFQPRPSSADDEAGPAGKKGSLRIGVFKRSGSGMGLGRRSSYDASGMGMTGLGVFGTGMSRSASESREFEVLAVPQFDWIAEESRNLGTLVITFWSRSSSIYRPDDEFEIVSVDAESVLVAPVRGGPASRLSLPCRVIPQQAKVVTTPGSSSTTTMHEVKLVTIDASPTKSRADLEVHTPLSADELRRCLPSAFRCSTCDAELVDSSSVTKYNALPSEHWAELLDAWMCHQDQELSADLIAKGKGIKPRPDEGLVGTSYVLLPREVMKGWTTPEGSEPTRSPSDDLLYPAHCTSCTSLIGSHVTPLNPSDPSSGSTSFRLLKYASHPVRPDAPVPPPRYSLASFLTAEMLETGQAHACHRFVLEDAETEKAKLLLWFFNPAVRLAFSTSSPLTDALKPPSSTSTSAANGSPASFSGSSPSPSSSPAGREGVKLFDRSTNAVKVFYAVVADDTDPRCADFLTVKSERLAYPAAVLDRLTELLRASTLVYPFAKRRFNQLEVGFLERI
ncbi:hypothetical protein JCM8097_002568 [Rhodosporidiobolus ruineniae]